MLGHGVSEHSLFLAFEFEYASLRQHTSLLLVGLLNQRLLVLIGKDGIVGVLLECLVLLLAGAHYGLI